MLFNLKYLKLKPENNIYKKYQMNGNNKTVMAICIIFI